MFATLESFAEAAPAMFALLLALSHLSKYHADDHGHVDLSLRYLIPSPLRPLGRGGSVSRFLALRSTEGLVRRK